MAKRKHPIGSTDPWLQFMREMGLNGIPNPPPAELWAEIPREIREDYPEDDDDGGMTV